MRTSKKIVSLVLAVLMVASMMVVGTIAASAATTVTTYQQFKDAINTNPYGTITLGADIEGTDQLTFTKSVTINLNGHNITNTAPWDSTAKEYYADFVIGDGGYCNVQFTGTGTVNLNNYWYGFRLASGALNIGENVTFNCPEGNMVHSGNLTVNGTITSVNWYAIGTNGSTSHDYSITVNEGAVVNSVYAPAIYHCQDGELKIYGGTITGYEEGVYVKAGSTKITGGTIKCTSPKAAYKFNNNGTKETGDALVIDNCDYPAGTPTVTITGGTFESANASAVASYIKADDPTTGAAAQPRVEGFIKGADLKGAEAVDEDLFAEGTTVTTEGGVTVVRSYVAEDVNTGAKYESVNEAIEAAGDNGEVKLIADINGNVNISSYNNTTLDLNGHTITNTSGSGITLGSAYSVGPVSFTIKDSSPEHTGTINSTKKYSGDACVSDSSGRKVTIEGGTYNSNANALYCSSDAGWTINGGTFNGNINAPQDYSNVTITGGTVNGDVTRIQPFYGTETSADIEISGGTFATDVTKFCTGNYVAQKDASGMYQIVLDPTNAEIEGYQLKTVKTSQSTEDAGNGIKAKGLRILTKVTDAELFNADAYGYVVAKVTGKEQSSANFANLKKDGGNGEKTINCKGSYNNGITDVTSDTYVTLAVNGMGDNDQVAVRFYVVKDGKTYYANYTNVVKYSGIIATMPASN